MQPKGEDLVILGAQGKIFISYRRDDAPGDARGICDRLGRSFGEANVFIDVDALLAGQRFDRELEKALAKCDVLIAVIGSRWLELLAEHVRTGQRDYVRDEIAAALKRDIVVIPVMIGREALMPSLPRAEDLPENIRDLVQYQKHNIMHESFRRDVAHLITAIKSVLRERQGPTSWRAIAAAGVIGLALIAAAVGYWKGVIPGVGPRVSQQTLLANETTISAPSSPATPSTKTEDETRRKAETDAKAADDAASKKAADEAAGKKAAEDAARQAADEEAARKASQQARLAIVTDCDRLAASPSDNDRPKSVAGVFDNSRIDQAAAAACDDAMRRYPEVARFAYQAGRAAFGRKDYARAEEYFRKAIANGSAAASAGLGVLYFNGFGVAQSYLEARNLYETAAAQGNSLAMAYLGALYGEGRGVTKDYAKARGLYEQGAALGNAAAMNSLGSLYANGQGVAQDYAEARKWYEKATALGNPNALRNLGTLFDYGRGVTKDEAAARDWYEKAAALGNPQAMVDLGNIYQNGRGVAKDLEQGRKWYEQAAALGNATAMYNLGVLYANAIGVGQDYVHARSLYEKAAAQGYILAMYNLGVIYENGNGVARNLDVARQWYQKAADAGDGPAKEKLTTLK